MQRSGMMRFWRFLRNQRGFTLLEAMVTVAILAILVGIGVPSFRATMERNRVTTIANDFLYHLQLTRSEAVKRNQSMVLCSSINGTNCSEDTDWALGWLITDVGGTTPIRVAGALPTGMVTPSPDVAEVRFNAVGTIAVGTIDGGTSMKFTVTVGTETRYVCLRISGAAQVSSSSCPWESAE